MDDLNQFFEVGHRMSQLRYLVTDQAGCAVLVTVTESRWFVIEEIAFRIVRSTNIQYRVKVFELSGSEFSTDELDG